MAAGPFLVLCLLAGLVLSLFLFAFLPVPPFPFFSIVHPFGSLPVSQLICQAVYLCTGLPISLLSSPFVNESIVDIYLFILV